jgi:hypothetical protein
MVPVQACSVDVAAASEGDAPVLHCTDAVLRKLKVNLSHDNKNHWGVVTQGYSDKGGPCG